MWIHVQVYTCIHAFDRWRRCPNPHLPPLPNFYIYPLPHSRKFRMGFPSTRTIKVASSSLKFHVRFPLHPYQRHFSYRCPVMSSTPYSNYTIFQQLPLFHFNHNMNLLSSNFYNSVNIVDCEPVALPLNFFCASIYRCMDKNTLM